MKGSAFVVLVVSTVLSNNTLKSSVVSYKNINTC